MAWASPNMVAVVLENIPRMSPVAPIPTASASADSTNHRSKVGKKNSRMFQKAELQFAMHWQLFFLIN